jgi:hypothetical protein
MKALRIGVSVLMALFLTIGIYYHVIGQETGADAKALYGALLNVTPSSLPRGYSSAHLSSVPLKDEDKRAGALGIVQVTLEGDDPKAKFFYILFPSAQQTQSFSRDFSRLLPAGNARKFVPYMPDADCADGSEEAACGLPVENVMIITTASKVERGAVVLLSTAKEHLESVKRSIGVGLPSPNPQPSNKQTRPDACALLTKAEAESALGGPVRDARPDIFGNCHYASQTIAGDGIGVEIGEGGRSKFEFDKNRINGVFTVSGIGDDAFAFISQAPFVQLYVLKGNKYFVVTVYSSRDPNRRETAKGLATKIVSRL